MYKEFASRQNTFANLQYFPAEGLSFGSLRDGGGEGGVKSSSDASWPVCAVWSGFLGIIE